MAGDPAPRTPPPPKKNFLGAYQLHQEGRGQPPCLVESPGEIEQAGPQRRFQENEDSAQRGQPGGGGCGLSREAPGSWRLSLHG